MSLNLEQSKPRVLWVDDEENILSSVRRLFRTENFDLITESNPVFALSLIESQNFQVVVSDQRMPQMAGIDFLSAVKSRYPETVRLMVTAFLDKDLIEEAVNRAGVYRFLTKPWDDQMLLLDLRQALKHFNDSRRTMLLRRLSIDRNIELERLTGNLERLVVERTRSLEIIQQNLHQEEVWSKTINRQLQMIGNAHEASVALKILRGELKRLGCFTEVFLVESRTEKKLNFMYQKNGTPVRVSVTADESSRLFSDTADDRLRDVLLRELGRPIGRLTSFALNYRDDSQQKIVVETIGDMDFDLLVDQMRSLSQPLAIVFDRMTLQEKMKKAVADWEATFDGIRDPLLIVDQSKKVLRANRPQNRNHQSNQSRTESRELRCFEILGANSPCIGCPLDSTPVRTISQIRVGGRQFEVRNFPVPLQDVQMGTFVHHYTDVTEKQTLYGRVIQSEKVAALGTLAGNIAHELNNPLTGIRSMAQILIRQVDGSSTLASDLGEIEKAAERSQKIVSNLREFASDQPSGERSVTDLNEVVLRTMPFLKTALRDHTQEIELTGEPLRVMANGPLLQQVVFNLVNNACQAMTSGGRVTIKSFRSGGKAVVEISDNGPGVPLNLQAKIFEPFFTTKPEGAGTGLGLSVSRMIIEEHGGQIEIQSEVGAGTVFSIILPEMHPPEAHP